MSRALYSSRQHTVAEICEQLGCSPATFYRRVVSTAGMAHGPAAAQTATS